MTTADYVHVEPNRKRFAGARPRLLRRLDLLWEFCDARGYRLSVHRVVAEAARTSSQHHPSHSCAADVSVRRKSDDAVLHPLDQMTMAQRFRWHGFGLIPFGRFRATIKVNGEVQHEEGDLCPSMHLDLRILPETEAPGARWGWTPDNRMTALNARFYETVTAWYADWEVRL